MRVVTPDSKLKIKSNFKLKFSVSIIYQQHKFVVSSYISETFLQDDSGGGERRGERREEKDRTHSPL